jgi:cardiolipin synthase
MATSKDAKSAKGTKGKDGEYPWWLKVLAGLGAAALVTAIVTLFMSYGRRPPDLTLTSTPAVSSPEFLASVAGMGGGPLRTGGSVQYLANGDGFFPVLLDDFRKARKTINFFVYIWEDGQVSDQILAVLEAKAQEGVQIRILLDGMGAVKSPEEKLKRLADKGAKIDTFRPARLGKLMRFHKRNHRRTIVVDGEVAFTGGSAVGDKWIGNADTEERWRDYMVRVTGPLAATVQSAFTDDWAAVTGEILMGPHVFPPQMAELPAAGSGGLVVHTGIASAPSSEDHPLRPFFAQAFAAARQKVYITTPYFVPDESLRRIVQERARAGVDVRILLPDEHTDAKLIRRTSHSYFEDLLTAGVRIYEYQPTMMHAKTVVVDGQWSIVGSANMDVRSKELNHENVLGILNAPFAAELERIFMVDLAKSEEITLAQWRKRGAWSRFLETIAPLLSEQY